MKNAERKKQQPSNLVVSTCIPRVLMYVCLMSAGLDVSRSIVNFVMLCGLVVHALQLTFIGLF